MRCDASQTKMYNVGVIISQVAKAHLVLHTDKSILNIDKLYQIWIVNTLIRLICYIIKEVRRMEG